MITLLGMSNPASELADLLEGWQVADEQSVTATRALAAGLRPQRRPSAELWRSIADAVSKIVAYERAVDTMEAAGRNVTHYRQVLPEIYGSVFAPDVQWGSRQSAAGVNVSQPTLANLRMAADAMEALGLTTLGADGIEAVRLTLRELRELVQGLPPSQDRDFLLGQVVQAIIFTDQAGRFGGDAVRETVAQVVVRIDDLDESGDLTDDQRSKMGALRRELILAFAGEGGGTLAVEAAKAGFRVARQQLLGG